MTPQGFACVLDTLYNPVISTEIFFTVKYGWKKAELYNRGRAMPEPELYQRENYSQHLVDVLAKAYSKGHRVFVGAYDPYETAEIMAWFSDHKDCYWFSFSSNAKLSPGAAGENIKLLVPDSQILEWAASNYTSNYMSKVTITWQALSGPGNGSVISMGSRSPRQYCSPNALGAEDIEQKAISFWTDMRHKNINETLYILDPPGEEEFVPYVTAFYKVFGKETGKPGGSGALLAVAGYTPSIFSSAVVQAALPYSPTKLLEKKEMLVMMFSSFHPMSLYTGGSIIYDAATQIMKDISSGTESIAEIKYLDGYYDDYHTFTIDSETNKQMFPIVYARGFSPHESFFVQMYPSMKAIHGTVPLDPVPFLKSVFSDLPKVNEKAFRYFALQRTTDIRRRYSSAEHMLKQDDADSILFSESFNKKPYLEEQVKLLCESATRLEAATKKIY